jgi:hypothetical protein
MRVNVAAPVAAVALIGVLTMASACGGKSSNTGTDADRAACASFISTLKLTAGQTAPAILLGNWRTTRNAAENADDAKLRASITSATRFVIEGSAIAPDPNLDYAMKRCGQIGAALPTSFGIAAIPALTPSTCVTKSVTAGGHTFSVKECG